jgi:hypothetical protein
MTAGRDSPFQPAKFLCSLSTAHAATRSFLPFSAAMAPEFLFFDVPRRLQRQGLLAPVPPDRQVAAAVRHSYASLAAPKSP